MTSVDSNFNFLCGRPQGGWTPSPVHMRPAEPDPPPLRVDVINGWPLMLLVRHVGRHSFLSYLTLGPQPVGVQCPLTSSLGEFPGNWDGLWYPGLPPPSVD